MVAHAFFKGLLFLGAGSVIHGLHDEQDLKRMGNLRRYIKLTFWTFTVGWLAIAGIPPLSGFWAKGDVLDAAWARHPVLWGVGLATALLTAYYMSRLSGLAFFGKDRWNKPPIDPGDPGVHAEGAMTEPHESPWPMRIPLIVLAILAFFGGVLSFPWTTRYSLLKWVNPVFGANMYNAHESTAVQWELAITDSVIAVIGVVIALVLWTRRANRPELEPTFLRRWWFFDALIDFVFSRGGTRLAQFSATVVEDGIIDGAVNGVGTLVRRTGGLVRKAQSGYVRNYALAIVLGVVGVLAFMLSRLWWS
jgi:NADH-quinone oxidoreductase subunit L